MARTKNLNGFFVLTLHIRWGVLFSRPMITYIESKSWGHDMMLRALLKMPPPHSPKSHPHFKSSSVRNPPIFEHCDVWLGDRRLRLLKSALCC